VDHGVTVTATMIPELAERPSVLPTERLLTNGMLAPELRAELRRIDDRRNAGAVLAAWGLVGGVVAIAVWLDNPLGYLAAFILMGPLYVRFAILMHEAAHKLLFSNKAVNDWVGKWLVAYPAFVPITLYRRGHFAHHRQEFGPDDPDVAFYGGYPCDRRTFARRLTRDAVGLSGWKNFWPLLRSVKDSQARKLSGPILSTQAVLWAVSWLATGLWWIYPLLWWLPWMTEWRVLNRLRSLAEHGGMGEGEDRRATTHHVRQRWLARFWLVPHYAGWHLAHHVDMGIPMRNLPRFHEELAKAGYVTDGLTYPSYRALWRSLAAG
jgi:fatty acid desaturase